MTAIVIDFNHTFIGGWCPGEGNPRSPGSSGASPSCAKAPLRVTCPYRSANRVETLETGVSLHLSFLHSLAAAQGSYLFSAPILFVLLLVLVLVLVVVAGFTLGSGFSPYRSAPSRLNSLSADAQEFEK
jgi:hypothetical protein